MANAKGGKKETKVERVEAEAKKAFPIDAKTHPQDVERHRAVLRAGCLGARTAG